MLGVEHLRKVVDWARERGALVASDECYLGLGWDADAGVACCDPRCRGGDHTGLLAAHSLSKTSSLAGYRAGFVAGDPAVVAELLAVRKHAGMMVPTPVQAAMVAALDDDAHEREQRDRYARRRDVLLAAVRAAGFTVDHSEAGLYLWATRGEPCRDTVAVVRRSAASWSRRASSTGRRGGRTCGSRSPRPTSGSTPPARLAAGH